MTDFHHGLLGVIRRAVESPTGSQYWTREEHEEASVLRESSSRDAPYVALAVGVRSELALVMRAGADVLAVVDIESRDPVITERYRRAINRLVQFATTLLSRLRSVGMHQHQRGVADALRAVSTELHAASGTFDMFLRKLGDKGGYSDDVEAFRSEIRGRLGDVGRIVQSYLAPSETILLRQALNLTLPYAHKIGVDLLIEPGSDVRAEISPVGLRWILENLLLNTRTHSEVEGNHLAWLALKVSGATTATLEYWDNGKASSVPSVAQAERGRGLRDIDSLCRHYAWHHEISRHNDGGWLHTFTFAIVGVSTLVP